VGHYELGTGNEIVEFCNRRSVTLLRRDLPRRASIESDNTCRKHGDKGRYQITLETSCIIIKNGYCGTVRSVLPKLTRADIESYRNFVSYLYTCTRT